MADSPLLLKVLATLGRVRVRERFIPGDPTGEIISGQCWGTDFIEINPVPDIVRTTLHECIHALFPAWSEQVVKAQTTKLMRRLSDSQMRTIYELYKGKLK